MIVNRLASKQISKVLQEWSTLFHMNQYVVELSKTRRLILTVYPEQISVRLKFKTSKTQDVCELIPFENISLSDDGLEFRGKKLSLQKRQVVKH